MIDIGIIISLMAIGYISGSLIEKRHYRSIERREREMVQFPLTTGRHHHIDPERVASSELIIGSAVISIDYFKRILAGLRNIFGGKVKSYESLIDRARREAVLRMKEKADGADLIINVRIETAAIGRSAHKRGIGCLEAIAYGTAVTLKPESI